VFWISLLSLLVMIAGLREGVGWLTVLPLTGLVFAKCVLILCTGSFAATLVRTRCEGKPGCVSQVVIAAIVGGALGVTAVFFAVDTPRAALAEAVASESTRFKTAKEPPVPYEYEGRWVDLATNIFFAILLGGGLALRAYLAENSRLKAAQHAVEIAKLTQQKLASETKLSLLQAQIEPHFLFNTLASVRALVGQEPDRARQTIDALVTYLRTAIPQIRAGQAAPHSTLGQQVQMANAYLQVMAIRMGGRLTVEFAVPHALAALPFPPLLLLSLVENAVKHGVEPKPGPVTIHVAASEDVRGALCVEVSDTGAGLMPSANAGVGLANIRQHLAERYGDNASLTLTESPEPPGGVRAAITIQKPQS
jgi:hypothetical protein